VELDNRDHLCYSGIHGPSVHEHFARALAGTKRGEPMSTNLSPSAWTGTKFFLARVFPWPCILIGAVMLFFGVKALLYAKATSSWPTAEGTMESASVEWRKGRHGGDRTYHVEMRYSYFIRGVMHTGGRVTVDDQESTDSAAAEEIVKRYPPRKAVTVYYSPESPSESIESVLEPGIRPSLWVLPRVGLILLAAGVLMAFFLPMVMTLSVRSAEPADEAGGL
jgi:hypothetical protein